MIEVRGTVEVIPSGAKPFGGQFEDTIASLRPTRILCIGIGAEERAANARSVNVT